MDDLWRTIYAEIFSQRNKPGIFGCLVFRTSSFLLHEVRCKTVFLFLPEQIFQEEYTKIKEERLCNIEQDKQNIPVNFNFSITKWAGDLSF